MDTESLVEKDPHKELPQRHSLFVMSLKDVRVK